jgi:hypothetical protein
MSFINKEKIRTCAFRAKILLEKGNSENLNSLTSQNQINRQHFRAKKHRDELIALEQKILGIQWDANEYARKAPKDQREQIKNSFEECSNQLKIPEHLKFLSEKITVWGKWIEMLETKMDKEYLTLFGKMESEEKLAKQRAERTKIKLRTFSGFKEDWIPFWEMFNALVHKNNDLTQLEKFELLEKSFEDSAQPILEWVDRTEDGYDIVIDFLLKMFENDGKWFKTLSPNYLGSTNINSEIKFQKADNSEMCSLVLKAPKIKFKANLTIQIVKTKQLLDQKCNKIPTNLKFQAKSYPDSSLNRKDNPNHSLVETIIQPNSKSLVREKANRQGLKDKIRKFFWSNQIAVSGSQSKAPKEINETKFGQKFSEKPERLWPKPFDPGKMNYKKVQIINKTAEKINGLGLNSIGSPSNKINNMALVCQRNVGNNRMKKWPTKFYNPFGDKVANKFTDMLPQQQYPDWAPFEARSKLVIITDDQPTQLRAILHQMEIRSSVFQPNLWNNLFGQQIIIGNTVENLIIWPKRPSIQLIIPMLQKVQRLFARQKLCIFVLPERIINDHELRTFSNILLLETPSNHNIFLNKIQEFGVNLEQRQYNENRRILARQRLRGRENLQPFRTMNGPKNQQYGQHSVAQNDQPTFEVGNENLGDQQREELVEEAALTDQFAKMNIKGLNLNNKFENLVSEENMKNLDKNDEKRDERDMAFGVSLEEIQELIKRPNYLDERILINRKRHALVQIIPKLFGKFCKFLEEKLVNFVCGIANIIDNPVRQIKYKRNNSIEKSFKYEKEFVSKIEPFALCLKKALKIMSNSRATKSNKTWTNKFEFEHINSISNNELIRKRINGKSIYNNWVRPNELKMWKSPKFTNFLKIKARSSASYPYKIILDESNIGNAANGPMDEPEKGNDSNGPMDEPDKGNDSNGPTDELKEYNDANVPTNESDDSNGPTEESEEEYDDSGFLFVCEKFDLILSHWGCPSTFKNLNKLAIKKLKLLVGEQFCDLNWACPTIYKNWNILAIGHPKLLVCEQFFELILGYCVCTTTFKKEQNFDKKPKLGLVSHNFIQFVIKKVSVKIVYINKSSLIDPHIKIVFEPLKIETQSLQQSKTNYFEKYLSLIKLSGEVFYEIEIESKNFVKINSKVQGQRLSYYFVGFEIKCSKISMKTFELLIIWKRNKMLEFLSKIATSWLAKLSPLVKEKKRLIGEIEAVRKAVKIFKWKMKIMNEQFVVLRQIAAMIPQMIVTSPVHAHPQIPLMM